MTTEGGTSGVEGVSRIAFMVLLTSENYHIWKTNMVDCLCCKRLVTPILQKSLKPDNIKQDEWAITDKMCLGVIMGYILKVWIKECITFSFFPKEVGVSLIGGFRVDGPISGTTIVTE